jgi:hypothetical protein
VGLLVLRSKLISYLDSLGMSAGLVNKFAESKDIKEFSEVLVLFNLNHNSNIREFLVKVK